MHKSASLTGELSTECEAILRRFEEAWQEEVGPDIDRYLPTPRMDDVRLLFELAHIDLDLRIRRGEPARVEHYLERFPLLKQERTALLELIAAEYTLRGYWQDGAAPEEYQ